MNMLNEYIIPTCEYGPQQTFLMLFSIAQISLFVSCVFVSKVYKWRMDESDVSDNEDDHKEESIYTDRYPIENAKQSVPPVKVNENSYVIDLTPHGIVIMKYNYDEEGFEYWSNKNVTYCQLETVARKYVTLFLCLDIYVDRKKILNEKNNAIEEQKQRNSECVQMLKEDPREQPTPAEPTQIVEETSVFAKFKSYNTEKDNNTTCESSDTVVISDKSNKYIHKGNVNDFEILKHMNVNESETHIKPIDFAEYKRMIALDEPKPNEQKKND